MPLNLGALLEGIAETAAGGAEAVLFPERVSERQKQEMLGERELELQDVRDIAAMERLSDQLRQRRDIFDLEQQWRETQFDEQRRQWELTREYREKEEARAIAREKRQAEINRRNQLFSEEAKYHINIMSRPEGDVTEDAFKRSLDWVKRARTGEITPSNIDEYLRSGILPELPPSVKAEHAVIDRSTKFGPREKIIEKQNVLKRYQEVQEQIADDTHNIYSVTNNGVVKFNKLTGKVYMLGGDVFGAEDDPDYNTPPYRTGVVNSALKGLDLRFGEDDAFDLYKHPIITLNAKALMKADGKTPLLDKKGKPQYIEPKDIIEQIFAKQGFKPNLIQVGKTDWAFYTNNPEKATWKYRISGWEDTRKEDPSIRPGAGGGLAAEIAGYKDGTVFSYQGKAYVKDPLAPGGVRRATQEDIDRATKGAK